MKIVVITGAGRGLGKATAEQFLTEGWKVIGTSTSGSGWESENTKWVQLDLLNSKSIARATEDIVTQPIYALVNNSGIYLSEEADASPADRVSILRKTLEVNLIGAIDFAERLIPHIESGGHIISIGSNMGGLTTVSGDDEPAYRISKVGMSMYTQVLAFRLRDKNIKASIIDPGWIKTDMGGSSAPREAQDVAKEIFTLATSDIPTGKFWKQGKERTW